jgi:hypothetical protein
VGRQVLGGRSRLTGQAYRSHYHQDNALLTFSPAGMRTERELDPFHGEQKDARGGPRA